jgi:hypothetical protein
MHAEEHRRLPSTSGRLRNLVLIPALGGVITSDTTCGCGWGADVTKRSGQRGVKQEGVNGIATRIADLADAKHSASSQTRDGHRDVASMATTITRAGESRRLDTQEQTEAAAELSRMIAELNEVRMRLDAIVRKLAQSAVEMPTSSETVDDVERQRMRLVGKLDRIRDQLVTRLGEERAPRDR